MAVLTIEDDLMLEVDQFAQLDEVSREEFVQKATRIYLREKRWERIQEFGREMRERGVTEEDLQKSLSCQNIDYPIPLAVM
jgi:metal-responsive CopG/Arc/MetJ family transcriptional regulator